MAQLYACSQNGDDAEPEDEVDERAQLMDISDDECKSRYVYCANYLLFHPQNFILADADAVAASRTNSVAMPLFLDTSLDLARSPLHVLLQTFYLSVFTQLTRPPPLHFLYPVVLICPLQLLFRIH